MAARGDPPRPRWCNSLVPGSWRPAVAGAIRIPAAGSRRSDVIVITRQDSRAREQAGLLPAPANRAALGRWVPDSTISLGVSRVRVGRGLVPRRPDRRPWFLAGPSRHGFASNRAAYWGCAGHGASVSGRRLQAAPRVAKPHLAAGPSASLLVRLWAGAWRGRPSLPAVQPPGRRCREFLASRRGVLG